MMEACIHGAVSFVAKAVKVSPSSDWLQPFSMAVITVTSFSDLPGFMEDDAELSNFLQRCSECLIRAKYVILRRFRSSEPAKELILTLRELPGHAEGESFRIPLRLQS